MFYLSLLPCVVDMIAQACCWWHCFHICGCIDTEREIVQTEPPKIVIVNTNTNPFINPCGIPKDIHLQSAYL